MKALPHQCILTFIIALLTSTTSLEILTELSSVPFQSAIEFGLLNPPFNFDLNCTKVGCGLYPNHKGDCSSFYLCSEGTRSLKFCHEGLFFDIYSLECKISSEATCWSQPTNGPFPQKSSNNVKPTPCMFHGLKEELSISDNATDGGIILSSPQLTNWGAWQNFQSCRNNSYISGIYAWKRLLRQGNLYDHAGIVSLAMECRTPDGIRTGIIESLAPDVPHDGWPRFFSCNGAGVGFQLNSLPDQGATKDDLATDNVKLICSCGSPAYKPYESINGPQRGNRGQWTKQQICGKGQALCGLQAQMALYREGVIRSYDNTGLNNVRMKCCDVPNPALKCQPEEYLVKLRSCSNVEGIYPRKCELEFLVGITYDYSSQSMMDSINFHSSIGYTIKESVMYLRKHFEKIQNSSFPWESSKTRHSWIWSDESSNSSSSYSEGFIYVPINSTTDIYQIVGKCGYFVVNTNRLIELTQDLMTATTTYKFLDAEQS